MTKKSDTEIDKIVDDLVGDEKTARALKQKLHETPDAPISTAPSARYVRADAGENTNDDDEDMWDNMPV